MARALGPPADFGLRYTDRATIGRSMSRGRSASLPCNHALVVRKEMKRFLALTGALDFDKVRALLHQLGSRWTPPSREALIAVLTDAAEPRH